MHTNTTDGKQHYDLALAPLKSTVYRMEVLSEVTQTSVYCRWMFKISLIVIHGGLIFCQKPQRICPWNWNVNACKEMGQNIRLSRCHTSFTMETALIIAAVLTLSGRKSCTLPGDRLFIRISLTFWELSEKANKKED